MPEPKEAEPQAAAGRTNAGKRVYDILIVDDQPLSRRIMRQCLHELPCRFREASNGLQALSEILRQTPDVVLLDVHMPQLGGLETLQEIRRTPRFANLPVISVSSRTDRDVVLRLMALGLNGFVVKPLQPVDTMRRVRDVLERTDGRSASVSGEASTTTKRVERALIVDPDPNFRAYLQPMLESRYEVVTADTGIAGLELHREIEADLIVISEETPLLGADRLIPLVRSHDRGRSTRVLLVRALPGEPTPLADAIDGTLPRTFVPQEMKRALQRALWQELSVLQRINRTIAREMEGEFLTAVQQTVGVMAGERAERDGDGTAPAPDVGAQVDLELGDGIVRIRLYASRQDTACLARTILGQDEVGDDDIAGTLSEIASVVAGRVCGSLRDRGYEMEQRAPVVHLPTAEDALPILLGLGVRTSQGERLRFEITTVARSVSLSRDAA